LLKIELKEFKTKKRRDLLGLDELIVVKRFYGEYLIFVVKNKITVVNNWLLSIDDYNELWINYTHSKLIDAWKDKANPFIPGADLYFIIPIDFRSDKNNMNHLFRGSINQSLIHWICMWQIQVDIHV